MTPAKNKPTLNTLAKLLATIVLGAVTTTMALIYITDQSIQIAVVLIIFAVLALVTTFLLNPLAKLIKKIHQGYPLPVDPPSNEFALLNALVDSLSSIDNNLANQLRNTQTTLKITSSKIETILSSFLDSIVAIDYQNKIVLTNSQFTKLTTFASSALVGQEIDAIFHLQDRNGTKATFADISRNSTNQINLTDNQPFHYLVGAFERKTPIQVFCSNSTSLTDSNIKSVFLIRNATSQSDFASIQLDFVSMASHELRTPLTSVIGYLSVFIDENKSKFTTSQMEFLDRIMISSKQLASLIENLLNVSKVERHAFSVSAEAMDWAVFLTKEVEDNHLPAANKNITISLSLPPNPLPKVNADPVRIAEVVNNLVSNAINYTNEGGHIEVGATSENNEVTTYVKDSGIGIPKTSLANIFTKFFRVKGALDRSSNSKGTGLGLYLCKSIIDLHHGRIWVESEVGKGSTFFFTLHAAEVLKPNLTIPNLSLTTPVPQA